MVKQFPRCTFCFVVVGRQADADPYSVITNMVCVTSIYVASICVALICYSPAVYSGHSSAYMSICDDCSGKGLKIWLENLRNFLLTLQVHFNLVVYTSRFKWKCK
jgi:hypothetical protein